MHEGMRECRETTSAEGSAVRLATMGTKTDLVVWLRLQPLQERVYKVRGCRPWRSGVLRRR